MTAPADLFTTARTAKADLAAANQRLRSAQEDADRAYDVHGKAMRAIGDWVDREIAGRVSEPTPAHTATKETAHAAL